MKQNYDFAIKELLKSEGGYTNDPLDSGGATNFGITITDYRKYIKSTGTPNDVKNMTVDQAKSIYKSKYWDALGCDNLESGVDYSCFDYGVLCGLQRPRNALQRFKDKKGPDLINAISDERKTFLQNLAARRPKDQKFLAGWMNRANRVRAQSLTLNKTPAVTTGVGPVIVAGSGAAAYSDWDLFLNHWVLYSLAAVATAIAVDVAIYYFRKK